MKSMRGILTVLFLAATQIGGCGGGGGGSGDEDIFLCELDVEVDNLDGDTYWLELGGYTMLGDYARIQLGYMPPGITYIPSGDDSFVVFSPGPFEFLLYDTQEGTLLSSSTTFAAIDGDILFIDVTISGGVITITDIF